jgi:hypothetical protein
MQCKNTILHLYMYELISVRRANSLKVDIQKVKFSKIYQPVIENTQDAGFPTI